MAKVTLTIQAHLRAADMRKLNPLLRRKGLTIEKAIEKGLKARIPRMSVDLTAFLAAMEGVGITEKVMLRLERKNLKGEERR